MAISNSTIEELDNEFEANNQEMIIYVERPQGGGGADIYLRVSEDVEDFIENNSNGTNQSTEWCPESGSYHNFYKKGYSDAFGSHMNGRYDSFGGEYVKRGNLNMGLLRTVGLSDGKQFHVSESYSEETLQGSVEQLKEEVREIIQRFIKPVGIKGSLRVHEI